MVRRFGLHAGFVLAACASWVASAALVLAEPPVPRSVTTEARISASELAALVDRGAVVILDVRDEGLFRRGHLPNARLVPPDRWREAAADLHSTGEPIVTYCSCPAEESSLRAASVLATHGVKGVRALTGGYEGWAAAGRPVVTVAAPTAPAQNRTPAAAMSPRENWQRVPEIFAAMGVAEGAIVADVGAGDGFFTTRLGKAVGPSGKVYAVDVAANALARLRTQVAAEGLNNVETILGTADDPKLPAGVLDAALIVNAYHEMREHQAMLEAIRRALKPTGRLVILDAVMPAARGWPRASQENRHQLAPHFVQQDGLAAGFAITRVENPFTNRGGNTSEYMIVFEPAPVAGTAPADPPHVHATASDDLSRQPDDVVAALKLQPGQTIVDIGAGSGLFTRRFARAVGPTGRAIGLDVEPAIIDGLKRDAASLGLTNYDARLVATNDPAIPRSSADVVFLSNTYHHIQNRVPYFTKVRESLKPGGRLVIVDFPPGAMGGEMPDHPDRQRVEQELTATGFRLVTQHDFLARQFFLEFVAR